MDDLYKCTKKFPLIDFSPEARSAISNYIVGSESSKSMPDFSAALLLSFHSNKASSKRFPMRVFTFVIRKLNTSFVLSDMQQLTLTMHSSKGGRGLTRSPR